MKVSATCADSRLFSPTLQQISPEYRMHRQADFKLIKSSSLGRVRGLIL